MARQLYPAIVISIMLVLMLGVAYPIVVWAAGNAIAGDKANGSLIKRNGVVLGSSLIGQNFTDDKYFHGRPSAISRPWPNIGRNTRKLTGVRV